MKTKTNNNNDMINVNIDWQNEECIGYDVMVAKCSSFSKRVRLFLKKKYSDGEGRFPRWYVNGALRRAVDNLGYGSWFIVETGNYSF